MLEDLTGNKEFKAIIFDFNGTLFWDSHFHEDAWNIMAKELRGYKYSKAEINEFMHGKTNREIIAYLIKEPLPNEDFEKIATKKENIYKDICLQNKNEFRLAIGVTELLDELVVRKIPLTIATSSDKGNVDFFFKHLDLCRWFDPAKVIYNDYTFPSKPSPDIFLLAAKTLKTEPQDCIVFEDSMAGIQAAINANIGRIVAVNSNENLHQIEKFPTVFKVINSFIPLSINELLSK